VHQVFTPNDDDSVRYQLRDPQGNILLETEDMLRYNGNGFVTAYNYIQAEMRYTPRAVYAPDASLLLDGVLGFIPEAPAPGGGMFVYLDETTCVLLYPDGTTVPVPSAPAVKSVYYGG
jgi:hypothetical protein